MQKAEESLSKDVVRRPKRLNDSMLPNDMNSSRLEVDAMDHQMEMPTTLIVEELTVSDSFFTEKINGHYVNNLLRNDLNMDLKKFVVDNLVIANNTMNFEQIQKKLIDSDKRAKRDTPITDASEPLVLNNIIVKGQINGIDFNYLIENALKTNIDHQELGAKINIRSLEGAFLETADGKLSNRNLLAIANIRNDTITLKQSMRFTKPLEVNNLYVFNRLNHIHIEDGEIDALFKRSQQLQVITGLKDFESISLLNPIVLQGKINITSPVLRRYVPMVSIDEDIALEGDFLFTGSIEIKHLIAGNIYGRSLQYNVAHLFEDGLKIDEFAVDVPLQFIQQIHIADVKAPTRINGVPIESLIFRNTSEVQKIIARKTFTSDLSIEGDCDAGEINVINLQVLNSTILRKSSKNQIIDGSIQFNRIMSGR